jgi:hypothetical protein
MSGNGVADAKTAHPLEIGGRVYRVLAIRSTPSDLPLSTTEYELTFVDEVGLNPEPLPSLSVAGYLRRYPQVALGLVMILGSLVVDGLTTGPAWDVAWFVVMAIGWALMFWAPSRRTVNARRARGEAQR